MGWRNGRWWSLGLKTVEGSEYEDEKEGRLA